MLSVHVDAADRGRDGPDQVLSTVLELRARGHRTVLVARPDTNLERRASEGLEFVALSPHADRDYAAGWRLSRVLKTLRPRIVHAHDPHATATAALALSLGAPTPRPHLVASRRVSGHTRKDAFSRWIAEQVTTVICASEAIRHLLIADGLPPEKAVTIYDGIDVDRAADAPAPNLHAEFWLPTHAPIIGNVAPLVPHEGHRYLLDAVPEVLQEAPDARLVIVGQGELDAALRRQIKDHRLDKHVVVTDRYTEATARDALYRGFTLSVQSALTGGVDSTLLHGMAAGRAVVATTAGAAGEIVAHGETGLLVPPRDGHALARALIGLLLDEPLRTRLGMNGAARVRERFSVSRMIDETLSLYRALGGTAPEGGSRHPAQDV